eukprot:SAG11_NODE_9920_length_870_cov_1.010376_1_plen_108_part_00
MPRLQANSPDVAGVVVGLLQKDLRCRVLERPTHRAQPESRPQRPRSFMAAVMAAGGDGRRRASGGITHASSASSWRAKPKSARRQVPCETRTAAHIWGHGASQHAGN